MERHLDLPDAHIAFSVEGSGETVLLMHGGFSPDWFVPAAARIGGHQVVTMQRAGYANSKDLAGGATVAAHAGHAAEVLRAVGAERAHVVGHSAGASVGLQLAYAEPELVGSLALFETAFPYAPDEPAMPGMPRAVAAAGRPEPHLTGADDQRTRRERQPGRTGTGEERGGTHPG